MFTTLIDQKATCGCVQVPLDFVVALIADCDQPTALFAICGFRILWAPNAPTAAPFVFLGLLFWVELTSFNTNVTITIFVTRRHVRFFS